MAHELEQLANGATAFATSRVPAWHRLGTVTDGAMTGGQAMSAASLGDWNVRTLRIEGFDISPNGETVRVDCGDKRMTVRTNPVTNTTDYLGIVGADYQVIQNEECAELLDRLVDESGAHFETAGSLNGGKRVFITMKLPKTMTIAGVDTMDLYLAFASSHDGTAAARVDATPVRIVCANTQRAALRRSVAHYEFRHTSGATAKIAEAREAIGLTWTYFDDFNKAAERMLNEQLTMDAFTDITARLWPVADNATDRAKTVARKRDASLRYLFRDADTQQAIKGTRWAGYQAVVEYVDHYAPASTEEVRARRAVTGTGAAIKSSAYDLLSVG